jgi:predicted phage terminase large subunit-like protein
LPADCPEILFGGAAGPGKSEALLMAALQFVDVPNYAAIIFRRTYTALARPGGLIDRAHEWLGGTAAKWDSQEKTWRFPSGAALCFGYLADSTDRYNYQSSEFQFIGFDELTEFREEDYLFLFSRLRRLTTSQVPLRMRAASNPGNVGHLWVKRRWGIRDGKQAMTEDQNPERRFIPARLDDNPHLDKLAYRRSLDNLPAFERKQLLEGDWSEFQGNHFHPDTWPRYKFQGDLFVLPPHRILMASDVWRFAVVDPATDAKRTSDYTAILVCGVTPQGQLLILDVVRRQLDVGDIIPALAAVCRAWHPLAFVGMESVAFQKLLVREADKHPDIPPVRELKPKGQGKLARAVPAIVKAERSEIYLPDDDTPWLDDFTAEVAAFTGNSDPHDDQADCLSYGVIAQGSFGSTSTPDAPRILTPGRMDPYSPIELVTQRNRTGALGYGAEGPFGGFTHREWW